MSIEFNATMLPDAHLTAPLTGHWRIESNDRWLSDVPFMRNGISRNFIQHGCTKQGEASFPEVRAFVSTWGHCNVFLNRTMLYEDLWLHTMYTKRMREASSNTFWADKSHTRYNAMPLLRYA
jgi:hypothetical protein